MSRSGKTTRVLYTGLDLPRPPYPHGEIWVHHPLIKVIPRSADSFSFEIVRANLDGYTHLVFTSKSAVRIFSDFVFPKKTKAVVIAVGESTAEEVKKVGMPAPLVPETETAEGLTDLLNTMDLNGAFILWPHSALSRPILYNYFQERNIKFHHPVLYDTVTRIPQELVDLQEFNEVYFTSPSTVDAFFEIYGRPSSHLKLRSIGPVTENYLQSRLAKF